MLVDSEQVNIDKNWMWKWKYKEKEEEEKEGGGAAWRHLARLISHHSTTSYIPDHLFIAHQL